jgi:hypothetical protein
MKVAGRCNQTGGSNVYLSNTEFVGVESPTGAS